MTQAEIVVPVALAHTNQCTITSPWFVCDTEYHPVAASYVPLINGEEAFKAVHLAIAQAKKSVDIICWGFQPSMYFIRDGNSPSIGELLMALARKGVKIRVLGWEYPFNAAGVVGEANLPGKGPIRIADRALQSSTQAQYDYDRQWFATCKVADGKAALLAEARHPLFVSRGFSWYERAEIDRWIKYESLDPEISVPMRKVLKLSASHHQKSVLVDYELPDCAIGFVMGHNMLDEYWDTDQHSALNRSERSKPAPNAGPRGTLPRQDISSQVGGRSWNTCTTISPLPGARKPVSVFSLRARPCKWRSNSPSVAAPLCWPSCCVPNHKKANATSKNCTCKPSTMRPSPSISRTSISVGRPWPRPSRRPPPTRRARDATRACMDPCTCL